jgi:hypothetical protein
LRGGQRRHRPQRAAGPSSATQSNFFTDAASGIRNSLQVTFAGMSLAELAALLRAHGVDATAHYASDATLDQFRALARRNLATSGDYLLVNDQRAAPGQEQIGHISPVAAYNAAADRLLVLDVASYYPPVWVSTAALWQAMNTIDDASGRTRGYVVVKAMPARSCLGSRQERLGQLLSNLPQGGHERPLLRAGQPAP